MGESENIGYQLNDGQYITIEFSEEGNLERVVFETGIEKAFPRISLRSNEVYEPNGDGTYTKSDGFLGQEIGTYQTSELKGNLARIIEAGNREGIQGLFDNNELLPEDEASYDEDGNISKVVTHEERDGVIIDTIYELTYSKNKFSYIRTGTNLGGSPNHNYFDIGEVDHKGLSEMNPDVEKILGINIHNVHHSMKREIVGRFVFVLKY